ncbi:MAG: hypothetical protein C0404_10060 [Verrucomicrobia bacterium]|nr:hypothetical protein [Verrucomicrobiota bacterium]
MRYTMILAGLAIFLAEGPAAAGETLAPERVLPLHEERDAYTPCAAFVKDNYIVAWQSGRLAPGDLREGYKFNADIVGCRIDKSGNALDAKPFVICKAGDLQERPRLAAGKDVALIVWHDLRNGKDWDVYAARVSPDGKVLDPDGFLVSGGAHNQACPRVAWDGKTFVVVWQDYRGGKKYEIYVARVGADGKVLDAEGIRMVASDSELVCYDPAVASSGDGRSCVFWSCDDPPGVYRRHPAFEGLFLVDGKPSELFYQEVVAGGHESVPGGANTPLFAAAGQTTYLLAWRTEAFVGRGKGGHTGVNAWFFDAQGTKGASLTLSGAQQRIMNADLAWDGSAFVAAWTEYVKAWGVWNGVKGWSTPVEAASVSRISEQGKLVGAVQEVAGKAGAPPAANVCVASDGAGTSLIAYEKHPETGDIPIKIAFRMLIAK